MCRTCIRAAWGGHVSQMDCSGVSHREMAFVKSARALHAEYLFQLAGIQNLLE